MKKAKFDSFFLHFAFHLIKAMPFNLFHVTDWKRCACLYLALGVAGWLTFALHKEICFVHIHTLCAANDSRVNTFNCHCHDKIRANSKDFLGDNIISFPQWFSASSIAPATTITYHRFIHLYLFTEFSCYHYTVKFDVLVTIHWERENRKHLSIRRFYDAPNMVFAWYTNA